MSRPRLEVAAIVRQHGAAFRERYGHTLSGTQHRALRALERCRTAALGGHHTRCDHCGHEEQSSNSCRCRSCPTCHGTAQAAWLEARQGEVLPTPYVHVLATLPQDLASLVWQNQQVLYDVLFHPVAQSLQDIAGAPKHLGAESGRLAVLHTWGHQLQAPPHLPCILPAGGVAADGSCWVPCRPDFFLSGRGRSRRLRRLFLKGLTPLSRQGELTLAGRCRELAEPTPWHRLLQSLRDKEWGVYAKKPCDSEHILKYLARYTHRVAISNHRLVALQDGQGTCRFKDSKRAGPLRTHPLDAVECLRRFCLPMLPKGLHKIRSFGFLANRHRQAKLALCRSLLGQSADVLVTHAMTAGGGTPEPEGGGRQAEPGDACPVCHQGRMQLVQTSHRHPAAWDLSVAVPAWDSS